MRLPEGLRRIDDRVLGSRGRRRAEGATGGQERTTVVEQARPPRRPSGDGLPAVLSVVYRVSRLVLVLLALAVALGVLFVLAPTNPDNAVVRTVLDLAEAAAGPFKDVFTVSDDADRETVVNYAFAAVVFLLLAAVVGRLPGGKS